MSHGQAIDEAIAEAEQDIVPVVGTEDGSVVDSDPQVDPEVNVDGAIDETAPAAADVDYSDDGEIISLPHLPDPKYDQDGEVLWFPRIIGGSRAQQGEFPSKVSLQTRSGSHFCGGNLITDTHIISAAHCVVTEDGILLNPASVGVHRLSVLVILST